MKDDAPETRTQLGEVVQIKLKTGQVVRGRIKGKNGNGIRLSDAHVTRVNPESGDLDDSMMPFPIQIEIQYEEIENIEIISFEP